MTFHQNSRTSFQNLMPPFWTGTGKSSQNALCRQENWVCSNQSVIRPTQARLANISTWPGNGWCSYVQYYSEIDFPVSFLKSYLILENIFSNVLQSCSGCDFQLKWKNTIKQNLWILTVVLNIYFKFSILILQGRKVPTCHF